VRQRVSRLRRYFKARWAAQTAAVAALLLVSLAIFLALRGKKEEIAPRPEPSFEPSSMPLPPPVVPLAPAPLMPAGSTDTPDAAPSASNALVPPPLSSGTSLDVKPQATSAPTVAPQPKKASKKANPLQSSIDSMSSALPAPAKPTPVPQKADSLMNEALPK
jgi:hypothetical protein